MAKREKYTPGKMTTDPDIVRPDGRGHIPDYDKLFTHFFQEYFYLLGVDVQEEYQEIDTSRKAGGLCYIAKKLFIDNSNPVQKKSLLLDNTPLLCVVIDSYLSLCYAYNIIPNIYNLSLCTGLNHNFFYRAIDSEIYNNNSGINGDFFNGLLCEKINELQELSSQAIEGRLLDSKSPVGAVAVANNSKTYGLQWAVNRAYNTATARKLVDSGGASEDFRRFLEEKNS